MKSSAAYPEHPNHVDKKGHATDADGKISTYTVLDEIYIPQTGAPSKLIYLQRLQFENKKIELRLCYFRIGPRGRLDRLQAKVKALRELLSASGEELSLQDATQSALRPSILDKALKRKL